MRHLTIREELENIVATGKIRGLRGNGRSSVMVLRGLKQSLELISSIEITQSTTGHDLWRDMKDYVICKAQSDNYDHLMLVCYSVFFSVLPSDTIDL